MLAAKTQYAIVALLELAQEHAEGRPAPAARIARRHGIPATFLVQILHELKRAGLVVSTRGSSGGYRLGRAAGEITLADVAAVLEPAESAAGCAANASPYATALAEICGDMCRARREVLEGTTVAELAERGAAAAGAMWYI